MDEVLYGYAGNGGIMADDSFCERYLRDMFTQLRIMKQNGKVIENHISADDDVTGYIFNK